jgi:hypothetical protein
VARGREPDLHAIRRSVERIGRASDSLVRLGPFSLGLDGVLSWVPGLGEAFSGVAAALILVQGVRARAPLPVLLAAAGLMASRTAITAIPLAGPALSDLFLAHKWSARMICREIDRKLAAAG